VGIVASVAETLFAERFAVSADTTAHVDGAAHLYDETRNLTVTPDGLPAVEHGITASTDTGTYAGREPPDSDRAWEAAASTDTLTKAGHERDHTGRLPLDRHDYARALRSPPLVSIGMAESLFAERFAVVESNPGSDELPLYSEDRNYNVTSADLPYVEAHIIASTNTFTRVNAEPSDADRSAWENILSGGLETRTEAPRDRDYC
jgi:hypothetical protein